MKPCVKCGVPKLRSERCKPCRAAQVARHREENREKIRAKRRSYYDRNRETALAQSAQWKRDNPDRVRAKAKAYSVENRDQLRLNTARWRAANRERDRANGRAWSSRNAVKIREKAALYRWKLKRQSLGVLSRHIPPNLWDARKSVFGYRCAYCGTPESQTIKLQKDHVKPIARGGPHILANLRPACPSCNSKKKHMDHRVWLKNINSCAVMP